MSTRHQHVADELRHLVVTGVWAPGRRLPSEPQLAARYHVSVPTLRQALEVLCAEGLIDKHQGRGNFVRTPGPRLGYPAYPGTGLRVSVSTASITASGTLAEVLSVAPGTDLVRYTYLTHRGDRPQSLAHVHVRGETAPRLAAHETSTSPWGDDLLIQLEAAGRPSMSSSDQVTARFPTATEAQLLRSNPRTPVLAIERTTTTSNAGGEGSVLAFSQIILPGDRAFVTFTRALQPKDDPHHAR